MSLAVPTGLSLGTTKVVPSLTAASRQALPNGSYLMITSTKECWIKFTNGFADAAANTADTPATGTLTLSDVANDDETVTIGTRVYTFKTALSDEPTVADEVLIGANIEASCTNLAAAINGTGTAGTHYGIGTMRHSQVRATSTATTVVVTALTPGTGGNTIDTTTDMADGAWGATDLASGANGATGSLHLPDNGEMFLPHPGLGYVSAIRATADGIVTITGVG